jgi:hypothetical protein
MPHRLQQRLYARRVGDAVVVAKHNLGGETQMQRAPEMGTQVSGQALKPLEGRGSLALAPQNAHENLGVAEIAGYLGTRNRDQPRNARILYPAALGEKRRHALADGFGDAI